MSCYGAFATLSQSPETTQNRTFAVGPGSAITCRLRYKVAAGKRLVTAHAGKGHSRGSESGYPMHGTVSPRGEDCYRLIS
jgi:hypothetical protein